MLRCASLAAVLVACVSSAQAQAPRKFPANALRGELVVTQPPQALLNQQPARLSPGSRIRGTNNLLVMSGAVVGQKLVVHYTLDTLGLVHEVWVLTPEELARKPWPTTPAQAAAWRFNPDAQTWSQP